MRYKLFMPTPDARERLHRFKQGMLDYIMDENPFTRTYVCVYEGEVGDPIGVREALWRRHNVGDAGDGNRPRPQEIRSMCIGDILLFESRGVAYIADRVGFEALEALPPGVAWEAPVV